MRDNYLDEDDEVLDAEENEPATLNDATPKASKAWRSIERYREMKELRKHLDDVFSDSKAEDIDELQW